jgi:hypothetical protein
MSSPRRKAAISPSTPAAKKPHPYARPCTLCTRTETCEACTREALCEDCTQTVRCGACRAARSSLSRAQGRVSLRLAASPTGARSSTGGCAESVDLPRSRDGLSAYYGLVATTTDAVTHAGGRWLFTEGAELRVELITPNQGLLRGRPGRPTRPHRRHVLCGGISEDCVCG